MWHAGYLALLVQPSLPCLPDDKDLQPYPARKRASGRAHFFFRKTS